MTIEEKRDRLVEELTPFEDPFERFAHAIDRAKGLEPFPTSTRSRLSWIKGCISQLWVFPFSEEGSATSRRLRRLHHQGNRRTSLRTIQWRNTRKHPSPRTRLSRRGGHHPTPLPQPQEWSHRGARKNQSLRPTLSRRTTTRQSLCLPHNLNSQCHRQRPFPYCLLSFISAHSRPNPSASSSARADAEPKASTTPPSTRTTENSLPPS